MSLSRSDGRKNDRLPVRNKICVVAFDQRSGASSRSARSHVGSERRRQIFRLVLPNQIHHVVGYKAETSARALARQPNHPTPRLARLTLLQSAPDRSRRACAFLHEPGTRKSNQDRKLKNDSIGDRPAMCNTLGHSRDPYSRRNFGPREPALAGLHIQFHGWL